MAKSARAVHQQALNYLSRRITAADMGTTFNIGTLPKGAKVSQAEVNIDVLFNGTTPVLDVGTVADPNAFLAASALGVITVVRSTVPTTMAAAYSATANLLVTGTLAGTSNTVGDARVYVYFCPNNETPTGKE